MACDGQFKVEDAGGDTAAPALWPRRSTAMTSQRKPASGYLSLIHPQGATFSVPFTILCCSC